MYAYDRIIQIQLGYQVSGNRLTCNFAYGADTALDLDDPEQLQINWQATMLPILKQVVCETVEFESIYAYAIKPETARPFIDQLNGQMGEVEDTALPENTAMVFQLRQYEANSKHNGRFFLAGLGEADCVDGLFTPGVIAGRAADLVVAIETVLDNGAGTNFKLAVVNRVDKGPPKNYVAYPVVKVVPTRAPGTQRRRTTESRSFH